MNFFIEVKEEKTLWYQIKGVASGKVVAETQDQMQARMFCTILNYKFYNKYVKARLVSILVTLGIAESKDRYQFAKKHTKKELLAMIEKELETY